jgi:moderate conductance mechanosensitive channel
MPDLRVLLDDLARVGLLVISLQLVAILLATLIALRFARSTVAVALGRLFQREATEGTARDVSAVEVERRRQTLEGLLYRALRVIVLIIAFLMALRVLNLDVGPAIAGLGIVGLAISLGTQDLVRDYVAGAFLLIENQYSRGDVVAVAGVTGVVEDVSLRRTSLRDADGTLHTIPHRLIEVTSNLTRSWANINLDIPVPYETDLDRVTEAINKAGKDLAADPEWEAAILEAPRVLRVERLAEQGLLLKVAGSVAATHRFEAAGELRRRIVARFDRDGLVLGWRPVPQRLASDDRKEERSR